MRGFFGAAASGASEAAAAAEVDASGSAEGRGLPVMAASSCGETWSLAVSICVALGSQPECSSAACGRRAKREHATGPRLARRTSFRAKDTHLPLLRERLVRRRLEEEHAPRDVDDRGPGHLAQGLSERERLGRKDVAVAVVRACAAGASPRRISVCSRAR